MLQRSLTSPTLTTKTILPSTDLLHTSPKYTPARAGSRRFIFLQFYWNICLPAPFLAGTLPRKGGYRHSRPLPMMAPPLSVWLITVSVRSFSSSLILFALIHLDKLGTQWSQITTVQLSRQHSWDVSHQRISVYKGFFGLWLYWSGFIWKWYTLSNPTMFFFSNLL